MKKSTPVLGYRLLPSPSNWQFIKHSFLRSTSTKHFYIRLYYSQNLEDCIGKKQVETKYYTKETTKK